jgi:galacturan 1,4-alpha-galacturonidase
MAFTNLYAKSLRGTPITISQCTTFSGAAGRNCTSSKFGLSNLVFANITGTTAGTTVASFQCSAVKPCTDIQIEGISLKAANGTMAAGYLCGNLLRPVGFNCTGVACVGSSATGGC